MPQRTAESKSCLKNYVLRIDQQDKKEKEVDEVDECLRFKDTPTVTWINIDGIYQRIHRNIGEQDLNDLQRRRSWQAMTG